MSSDQKPISADQWIARIQTITVWSKGGQRAPHKPLTLLYALGRLQREGSSRVTFGEAAPTITHLLQEFGPPRDQDHPEMPFVYLKNDKGIWTVDASDEGVLEGTPGKTKLVEAGATGGFSPAFEAALKASPALQAQVARSLLDSNFEETLHSDICEEVGLDLDTLEVGKAAPKKVRDPKFRQEVLLAYEYRCAICGFEGRMGLEAVALDAAHVRWWAVGGPDSIENALCLCSLHHKLFDRGALSLDDNRRVLVSQHFIGHHPASKAIVLDYAGAETLLPQKGEPAVLPEYVAWHRAEVFKAPARQP